MKTLTTHGMRSSRLGGILALAIFGCGCNNGAELSRSQAKAALEAAPVKVVGEIVSVSDAEFDCAVKAGLFFINPYNKFMETDKGESLGFASPEKRGLGGGVEDPDLVGHWMLEFHAKLKLTVDSIEGISDGRRPGVKVVGVKGRLKVPHACFPVPLRIWQNRAGKVYAFLEFDFRRFDDGWRLVE
jgi:hypothetical protein